MSSNHTLPSRHQNTICHDCGSTMRCLSMLPNRYSIFNQLWGPQRLVEIAPNGALQKLSWWLKECPDQVCKGIRPLRLSQLNQWLQALELINWHFVHCNSILFHPRYPGKEEDRLCYHLSTPSSWEKQLPNMFPIAVSNLTPEPRHHSSQLAPVPPEKAVKSRKMKAVETNQTAVQTPTSDSLPQPHWAQSRQLRLCPIQ